MKKLIFLLTAYLSVSCGTVGNQPNTLYDNIKSSDYASNITLFEQKSNDVITIDIPANINNDNMHRANMSDLFDSISILKLSNDPNALLAVIDKIEVREDVVVVSDKQRVKSVKAFDSNGNYLCSYGQNGRGPGEYIEPTTFILYNNTVKIYDQYQAKILQYDITGEFIGEKQAPFIFKEFVQIDDNRYLFHCYMEDNIHLNEILNYMLVETDSNFVISHKGLFREYNKYSRLGGAGRNLYKIDNRIYSYIPFVDTLYNVVQDTILNASYYINYGKRKLSEELLKRENTSKAIDQINTNSQIMSPLSFVFEMSNNLIFNASIQTATYTAFYNKTTNRLNLYNACYDDLTLFFGNFNFITAHDGCLIGVTESSNVSYWYAEFYKSIRKGAADLEKPELLKYKRYIDLASNVKESDNVVLVYYHLKNH